MPGGDRTGPLGAGAMTGRGVGFCSGNNQPGFVSAGFGGGRGFGRGFNRGGGRGRRNRFYATGVPGWARWGYNQYEPEFEPEFRPRPARAGRSDELAYLKEESQHLQAALESINERIEKLENK